MVQKQHWICIAFFVICHNLVEQLWLHEYSSEIFLTLEPTHCPLLWWFIHLQPLTTCSPSPSYQTSFLIQIPAVHLSRPCYSTVCPAVALCVWRGTTTCATSHFTSWSPLTKEARHKSHSTDPVTQFSPINPKPSFHTGAILGPPSKMLLTAPHIWMWTHNCTTCSVFRNLEALKAAGYLRL